MMKNQRGFSIAEVLTVTVILGILMSAMVVVIPAMLHAPMQMQSQVDQVNTAALALYKIRRDFSEGDTSGVMGCNTTPIVTCSALGQGLRSVQAMAVITAENPPGTFNVNQQTGYPAWQAFYIYWLEPDPSGQAFDLMRAWEPLPNLTASITSLNGVPQNVSAAMVTPLVTAAMVLSPAPVLTNYIEQINLGDNPGSSMINFELVAGTFNGGNLTQTNFPGNTYARN
jgi:prepilin-type N-terminal cleavage/methylation domain-containing protein